MTGYEAFSIYHTLKLHFTSDYDYFKYNGKCNISPTTFENRRDKYHFYKLSRKYPNKELVEEVPENKEGDANIEQNMEDDPQDETLQQMNSLARHHRAFPSSTAFALPE